ncbi:MAG TPA: hypothetical protein VJN68_01285 [Burkholderiaceae bacterium]|nr:hypothetical protein [Burkholderiaceae bacterium]
MDDLRFREAHSRLRREAQQRVDERLGRLERCEFSTTFQHGGAELAHAGFAQVKLL